MYSRRTVEEVEAVAMAGEEHKEVAQAAVATVGIGSPTRGEHPRKKSEGGKRLGTLGSRVVAVFLFFSVALAIENLVATKLNNRDISSR